MQEKEKAKRLQSEPDEEGWVTIGKGGRKPGASKLEAAELLDKKKKKKQKVTLIFKTMSVRKMMERSNVKGGRNRITYVITLYKAYKTIG